MAHKIDYNLPSFFVGSGEMPLPEGIHGEPNWLLGIVQRNNLSKSLLPIIARSNFNLTGTRPKL